MPIKAENKPRYPADWKRIRLHILGRAGDRCEGSPRYPDCRAKNGEPHPVTGSRVVLTIAHRNHVVEDSSPENLAAWCQRCHLTHDAAHHAANARATRRAGKAAGDLFPEDEAP